MTMIGKICALVLSVLMLSELVTAPASAGPGTEITVSAAISLKNVFEEAGKVYEAKNRGVKVVFNFGASGDLMQQVEGGAPVDVFVSAAQKDMDELSGKGLIIPGSRADIATNSVALVIPTNSNSRIKSVDGLTSGEIKRIAVGNFRTTPAGRYSEDVFNYYRLLPAISDKLVFAENVRQVLDYVARGEVDAGIVYSTDAQMRAKEVRVVATAPPASHKPIVYPIAVVKGTGNEAAAKGFVAFILSSEGKKILEKYGFKVRM
jgi:molybdate transport system substrate-binding protein